MREFNIKEVVGKLVGDIYPIGESNHDEKCLANLEEMILLATEMFDNIFDIAYIKNQGEASIVKCKIKAEDFINFISEKYYEN